MIMISSLVLYSFLTVITPDPINVTLRQGVNVIPLLHYQTEGYQVLISSTDSGSYVFTGILNTACSGPCITASPASGTSTRLNFNSAAANLVAGTYTGTVSNGGASATITVTVVAPLPYSSTVNLSTQDNNACLNTSTLYTFTDTCTNYGNSSASTATQVKFNAITPAANVISYSSMKPECNGLIITRSNTTTDTNIYNISTKSIVYPAIPFIGDFINWDNNCTYIYQIYINPRIDRLTLPSTVTTVADYSATYDQMFTGGTGAINNENYYGFYAKTPSDPALTYYYGCIVQLTGLSNLTRDSQTWCLDARTYGGGDIDYFQISPTTNGKGVVLAYTTTGLLYCQFDASIVGGFSNCYIPSDPPGSTSGFLGGHSDFVQKSDGTILHLVPFSENLGNGKSYLSLLNVKGKDSNSALKFIETGGGNYLLASVWNGKDNPVVYPTAPTAFHVGCQKHLCVISHYTAAEESYPNLLKIWLYDSDKNEYTILSVAKYITYSPINYDLTPRAALSKDLCYVYFNANFGAGITSTAAVIQMPSSYCPSVNTTAIKNGLTSLSVTPLSTKAIVNYTAPNNSTCQFAISTTNPRVDTGFASDTPTLQNDNRTGSFSNGNLRQVVLGTVSALTASTTYYGKVVCPNSQSIKYFQFTTLAVDSIKNVAKTFNSSTTLWKSSSPTFSSYTDLGTSTNFTWNLTPGEISYIKNLTNGQIQLTY